MNTNSIEKYIQINAPVSRVWQALTDYRQFAVWFEAKLAEPFVAGRTIRGENSCQGAQHTFEVTVQRLEPEQFFSYTWHPYAPTPDFDYSQEPPTLVEFRLEKIPGGTMVHVTESGFDKLPPSRRTEAFPMHTEGWIEQLNNLARYVSQNPA